MARANPNPTTKFSTLSQASRRAFVVGAASTALVPAAVASSPPAAASAQIAPDAELIALGKQFDQVVQDYQVATARLTPFWNKQRSQFEDWQVQNPSRDPDELMTAYSRIADQIGLTAQERLGEHPDDITERAHPISEAILRIPATALVGLAVKARLAAFGAEHFWKASDDDADWDQLVVRKLIDAVIALAASKSEN
jgi:hypothetical protein